MWCAEMPSAQIEVFHLHYQRTSEGAAFAGFPSRFELQERKALDTSLLLAIGDPYTFPMDLFLNRTNEDHPGLRVMGGMGSAASRPGDSRLLCDDQCVNHGAVFVFIEGPTTIATVVSQGCRPIGEPLVITRADRNMIEELGGKPAYDRLANLYNTLPTQEQRLVQQALHLGVAMSEFRESFGYGDFLIRNVVATDGEAKTIQVGDFVKIGQTVQFHIRDHESASSDLKQRLKTSRQEHAPLEPSAALVFTCNGRGVNLFPEENHDAQMVQEILGEIPAGGFFAAGEIGPIVEQNFVHGFTCCVVWFC